MPKDPPPLLGFNNNVKHEGRIFHIQTEDSGIRRPRIVTHLFADGGRILKTTRTDYSEHLGRDDMVAVVKRMMKGQHKAMFIALRAGELDALILEACGPLSSAAPSEGRSGRRSKPPPKPSRPPPRASEPPPSEASSSVPTLEQFAPTAEQLAAATAVAAMPRRAPRARSLSNPSLRRVGPSVPPPSRGELELDVASLDEHPPAPRLPDAAVGAALEPLAGHESGTHRAARSRTPPPLPSRGTPALGTPSSAAPQPSGKYAASRPAAIFTEPSPEKRSIFGESMISEKSLDEVILSYLADDLETPSGD
ncbi:MAG: hypothetical protein OZ921_02210 [Sorangiineae bacterium]|nr:hypothetical protein [Polyangiaceae bacterium]MEB2321298.1 hypothetical protein [Sorangiineae bacterium]